MGRLRPGVMGWERGRTFGETASPAGTTTYDLCASDTLRQFDTARNKKHICTLQVFLTPATPCGRSPIRCCPRRGGRRPGVPLMPRSRKGHLEKTKMAVFNVCQRSSGSICDVQSRRVREHGEVEETTTCSSLRDTAVDGQLGSNMQKT